MKSIRRIYIGFILVCLIELCGCSMLDRENQEVKKYLESRYGSLEFEITKIEDGESVSYQVVPADFPEAAFTVEEGTIEESWHWNYHDNYAACMLYDGAERLGLTYEKDERIEGEYNIFIMYKDYLSIDETAEKVEQLVTDCLESHAFDNMANRCLITVKPAGEPDPAFPGYEIRIKTAYASNRVDKLFGIMASDLVPGQLKEDLRLCHIYNALQYTVLKDISMFSEDDMERYQEMCSGAMSRADDGSITVYELVDGSGSELSFGGAYQILLSEGLVTEEKKDSFIASGNGITIEFFRTFDVSSSNQKPKVSCEILSGEVDEDDREELSDKSTGSQQARYAIRLLADKGIEFSTPEKIAAAAEEERLARLPLVQDAFSQAANPGEMTSGTGMEVTVTGMETYERLQGSNSFYMDSGTDTIWTRISIRIKNTGNTDMYLFPLRSHGSESQLTGIIADEEANLYRPTDIINLGLEDIYSYQLQAGDTVEGNIYIKLPRELAAKEDSLVLWIFRGESSVSALLPAVTK